MYESYYGFSGKPFQLNPDPRFFFRSRQHRRAMSFVEYGLHQAEGFVVITGEVGSGKTTIVRNLLATLDQRKIVAANLVSTQLDAEDTLRMVTAAFGIGSREMSKGEMLLSLEALLASHAREGRRCLLVVDEAQNLTPRAVEELRMLSNFQLGTHALLQSFLVGQPELRRVLQSPGMHQLRQRVIASCHIGPLDAVESRLYVEHRLRRVGWKDMPAIEPEAFVEVFEATGGVPRRMNLLCDRVLLTGFLSGTRVVTAQTVREVWQEIDAETQGPAWIDRPTAELVGSPGREPLRIGLASPAEARHPDAEANAAARRAAAEPGATPPSNREGKGNGDDLTDALDRLCGDGESPDGLLRAFADWLKSRGTERSGR